MQLNSEFKQDIRASESLNNKRDSYHARIHRRRRKMLRWMTVAFLVVCGLTIGYRMVQYKIVKQQIAEVNQTVAKAKQTNLELKQQVTSLHDSTYLQQLIREKYMYTKDGEQVYNLPATDPDANK
ncbi:FtsB family cell division protein [Periweissella fabalis]|uniref:Septum formation initiator family protein n=1 Tax=Periweissella fabalis TaxID=1070421 RepID=A0A7X6N3G7_9LACO|nr:septum formation initiator family protein [Periweissella fabalis]MCM0599819.1 septum formation initiator family protein [Periweissella fabalis]NKZ24375.1 septum formation initiator family protein [Periweissella fabalis]